MYCISNLELLVNGILTIVDDEKNILPRINEMGIPGALAFEENRKTQLLKYICDSQRLIESINNRRGNKSLNHCLYHQIMKAILNRKRDWNVTANVIKSLRSLHDKISQTELNNVIGSLENIMKAVMTTVDVACWVLHIPENELSMYKSADELSLDQVV